MAREVPRDQPLSDEDREYLLSRGYDDLVVQIDQNHPGGGTPSQVTNDPNEPFVDDPNAVEDDYDEWTVDELDTELRSRSLPVSGKKDEKINRLRTSDSQQ